MWGRRLEHGHKCSWQRSLHCTCFTFVRRLMRLNAWLIEFISIQILLGVSASGDTVTTVFIDSPALQFVLNYLCSSQAAAGRTAADSPRYRFGFHSRGGHCWHRSPRWSQGGDTDFPLTYRGLSHTHFLCLASLILLLRFFSQRKTMRGENVSHGTG